MLVIVIAGCRNELPSESNVPVENPFTGVYINTRTGTDTIDFDHFRDSPTFNLHRGDDTLADRRREKSGTGYYRFSINNEKIKLQWSFASVIDTTAYHFQMKGDSLLIGNFYEKEREGVVETFIKLK